jgi:hypothetical protein
MSMMMLIVISEDNPFENKEKMVGKMRIKMFRRTIIAAMMRMLLRIRNDIDDEEEGNDEEVNKEKREEITDDTKDEESDENETEQPEDSGMDQTQTNEDNVEAMEVDNADATDKVRK